MSSVKRLLVTGATGKVGKAFLKRFAGSPEAEGYSIRAITHNRDLNFDGVESFKGSLSDRELVKNAMQGVTHVLHLATCKETPLDIMDVAVKGMFWLLEESRVTEGFERFVLIGGDAGMGHFIYPHPIPVTEQQKHSAYKGCYALSKVLEEVMLEQYYIQYDLDGCCLRAPWIMEKDDFKYTLSFGEDVFGGPRWRNIVGPAAADDFKASGTIPVLCDETGAPVLRNFVHVDDLVESIIAALEHPKAKQQTFNICMNEPVDYRKVGDYLHETRGLPFIDIKQPVHSTWLDNDKAKFLLGWRPKYDLAKLIDSSFDYQRTADDPRVIWYPG